MEEASRGVSSSEMIVRGKPEPACPKPHATLCCPSAVLSIRPPSHTRLQPGAHPVRDGVNLAVAPQGNGLPWQSNDRWCSLLTRRLPPGMAWQRRWGGRARKPRKTCLRSRRCGTIPWCLSHGCRLARWRRRRSGKRRGTGWSASAWLPLHEPSSGPQMRPTTVRLTVEKNTAYAAADGHGAPAHVARLAGADVERAPAR
jgi:hypothetical protein